MLFFFLLSTVLPFSHASLTLTIDNTTAVIPNTNMTVGWLRDESDPLDFFFNVRSADDSEVPPSPPFSIHLNGSSAEQLNGEVDIPIMVTVPGRYHLVAVDAGDPSIILATSDDFNVTISSDTISSNLLTSSATLMPSVSVITVPSQSTGSSEPTSQPTQSGSSLNKPALVIGSVLGVFGILLLVALILFFKRCQSRRRYLWQRGLINSPWSIRFFNRNKPEANVPRSFTPFLRPPGSDISGDEKLFGSLPTASLVRTATHTTTRSEPVAAAPTPPIPSLLIVPPSARPSSGSTALSDLPSPTPIISLLPNRFKPPLTDRQMELEERIHGLQSQLIALHGESLGRESVTADLRVWKLRGQIDKLRALQESSWALGMTDTIPADLRT